MTKPAQAYAYGGLVLIYAGIIYAHGEWLPAVMG